MAYTGITRDLAAKYPKEFGGRVGETVPTSEVQSVMRRHGDAKTVGEQVAEKKGSTAAPAAAAAPAPRARSPRKTATKK